MSGPTIDDETRLADIDLWIEVEQDLTTYGEEARFGGGEVICGGMGQGQMRADACVDLVITNALIIDHWGTVRADIGIKNGRIFAIDKAGNPGIQPSVTTPIGVGTEIIVGEGKVATAGGVNTHIHWVCSQQAQGALVSGAVMMIGGGTGPTAGIHVTTRTPGLWYTARILQAADTLPVNIGLLGKGNGSNPDASHEQINAGAIGLKIHEDWGVTPVAIDYALAVADETDIQVALHSDTFNESGFVEDMLAAIGDRTIYAFHIEGAGGGHAPDIITACAHLNILPLSTNPTLPYTVNTIDEHFDMLMACHYLDPDIAEDVASAKSRIRREITAAEDVLYDTGASSLTSSDSQAVRRAGEAIPRIRQVVYRMRVRRGPLAEEADDNDSLHVKRYVTKYTINPVLTHSIAHEAGPVESSKLADLVLWSPAFFGVKPMTIVKSGMIVCVPMGDINASIPTPQPVHYCMISGALGAARHHARLTFISQAADAQNIPQQFSLQSAIATVKGCWTVKKVDMIHNGLQPSIAIDAQTYEVRIDDELIVSEPADVLPMA